MHTSTVENISDTAFWVAYYRAQESARSDALFHDSYAAALAGAKGRDIAHKLRGRRIMHAWALTPRTTLIDRLLLQALEESPFDTVINLAAGLDTRPYRMDLPRDLTWIDVDLPGIISYKETVLQNATANCRRVAIAADLADDRVRRQTLATLCADKKRVLVLTEGLLVYLNEQQARALANDLYARPEISDWLFDLLSPLALKRAQRMWHRELLAANAPLQFAPVNGLDFFAESGWHEARWYSFTDELKRINRLPWPIKLFVHALDIAPRRLHRSVHGLSGIGWLRRGT